VVVQGLQQGLPLLQPQGKCGDDGGSDQQAVEGHQEQASQEDVALQPFLEPVLKTLLESMPVPLAWSGSALKKIEPALCPLKQF
jgi:hypothetical protein